MIPKIIHYCWFGGNPLPPLALECIASWKKYLPDYEIWMWKESNDLIDSDDGFVVSGVCVADKVMGFDVNSIPYTAEAYKQKKYAFVSDYARFWVMYKYGGIYFDTDVEVIRPLDDIIANGNFMGFEQDPDGENTPGKYAPRYCFAVNPGVGFGMEKEHLFMKRMLDYYSELHFEMSGMGKYNKRLFDFLNPFRDNKQYTYFKTIVMHTTEKLMALGLKNVKGIQKLGDITIYPREYFAPINVISRRMKITKNTYTIHRYMGSWMNTSGKGHLKAKIRNYIPELFFITYNKIMRQNYRIR